MIKIIKYIQISLFITLSFGLVNAQNDIKIESLQDSTIVGLDAVFNISIPSTFNNRKFNLAVFDVPTVQSIYKGKYNFSRIDSSEQKETDFEISDFGKWKGQDQTLIIGKANVTNQIKIKIWDSGVFMILPFIINETSGSNDTIYPDRIEQFPNILVFPSSNPNDTIRDFTPIKDILREDTSWRDYLIYIYTVLGLILLVSIGFLVSKYMKRGKSTLILKEKEVIITPAHIIALEKLNELKKEEILKDNSKIKEFQTKLTYALREYLENRYKFNALEQTTGEISNSLSKISIEEKDVDLIQNILQIADLVKFAKAKSGEEIHREFLNNAIDFVKRTKKIENVIEGQK